MFRPFKFISNTTTNNSENLFSTFWGIWQKLVFDIYFENTYYLLYINIRWIVSVLLLAVDKTYKSSILIYFNVVRYYHKHSKHNGTVWRFVSKDRIGTPIYESRLITYSILPNKPGHHNTIKRKAPALRF